MKAKFTGAALVILSVATAALRLRAQDSSPTPEDQPKQLAKLTASDGAGNDRLGYSVAISGNTVAVGAPGHAVGGNAGQGAVYIFIKSANGWGNITQVAELTASDGAAGDKLGWSVAVSGNTLVAGAPNKNGSQGAAYVFVEPAGGWINGTESAELTGSDETVSDTVGFSVAISGNTAVVGAPQKFSGPGAAYLFVEPSTGWTSMTQTSKLTAPNGVHGNQFGLSVSIGGSAVAIGAPVAPLDDGPGEVYVFVKPAGGWPNNLTQKAQLIGSDAEAGFDDVGVSVAVNGGTILAGDTYFGAYFPQGAAYLFVEPQSGWVNSTETAKVVSTDQQSEYMGTSVSISGGAGVAGAPGCTVEYFSQGCAYLFLEPSGGWIDETQTARLTASDARADNYLGTSVSIDGSTIVAGAWGANIGSNYAQGAAYVFGP
jgi:hypothetical protein